MYEIFIFIIIISKIPTNILQTQLFNLYDLNFNLYLYFCTIDRLYMTFQASEAR